MDPIPSFIDKLIVLNDYSIQNQNRFLLLFQLNFNEPVVLHTFLWHKQKSMCWNQWNLVTKHSTACKLSFLNFFSFFFSYVDDFAFRTKSYEKRELESITNKWVQKILEKQKH